jgi:hypothetical protein
VLYPSIFPILPGTSTSSSLRDFHGLSVHSDK